MAEYYQFAHSVQGYNHIKANKVCQDQGTPNIDNNKITEKRCKMDYFILVINKDEHTISSEFALNHDGARSDCGMKVDLYSLCGKLTRAASDYYHSNKELFDFFQYQLIQ